MVIDMVAGKPAGRGSPDVVDALAKTRAGPRASMEVGSNPAASTI